jgi:hypothetical protein
MKMLRIELGEKPLGLEYDDLPDACSKSERKYSGHYRFCPKMPLKCDFYNHGCTQEIRREDLEDHHAKSGRKHAQLVAEDKGWQSQTINWDVPSAIIREAGLGYYVHESDRVQVGEYLTFIRLAIYRGECHLFVCVDKTLAAPDIDSVDINVENDSNWLAWVDTEKASELESDGSGNGTWLVGGTLKCEDDDTDEHEPRRVTRRDVLQWCAGADMLAVSASFRLKRPEAVDVNSVNPSNTHVGEGFRRFLERNQE